MTGHVHLGFEIGTGEPVSIPLRHMVVTGQTQEAGKTTTLEALIARANLPAVAFVTKRGERSFAKGARIAPYFRERADWQFVASVLEATMRERLKFERAWIIRASKGAKTLADVHANVRRLMASAKGLSADVYLTLDEYLSIVVPRIAQVRFAHSLNLQPGLNVLDVSDRERFPPELQALVMRSVLEWVYERADGTITIIPEAWEFIPQARGSPVKLAAIELIRKGAGLHNFVWLDSQDIGGVDKELLRSCPVWLLGVQREANEIKRVLENIPAGVAKPKPADVATLERGQFFACYGRHVIRTYVQPAWVTDDGARAIALGLAPVSAVRLEPPPTQQHQLRSDDTMTPDQERKLDEVLDLMRANAQPRTGTTEHGDRVFVDQPAAAATPADEEALYQRIKARLVKEAPAILKVLAVSPEIALETEVKVIKMDGSTLSGRLARMVATGYFDDPRPTQEVARELKRTGADPGPNTKRELDRLRNFGFLREEPEGFQAVPDMKRNVKGSR